MANKDQWLILKSLPRVQISLSTNAPSTVPKPCRTRTCYGGTNPSTNAPSTVLNSCRTRTCYGGTNPSTNAPLFPNPVGHAPAMAARISPLMFHLLSQTLPDTHRLWRHEFPHECSTVLNSCRTRTGYDGTNSSTNAPLFPNPAGHAPAIAARIPPRMLHCSQTLPDMHRL
ncbi:hypothetical protein DPMN_076428 [Dreissena polymorpha]|uniref:Uncharacterized protein n=1 Tax=Dreissena polymorpha TaxID=45954 RepID=A0A9D3YLH5_DREPO|nr:hypothetical protein DPMN_076428 [Dreissena polymorpha]